MEVSSFCLTLQIKLADINKNGGVTVKDVSAKEFIETFAKHLKKGNKLKMPEVRRVHTLFQTY